MSWKDWQIGEVVTESDFQNLVQDQVVQRYADSSARSTTLGTAVAEGMVSYLEDTNKVQVYTGSDWVDVGQEGDITAVTAGTGLSGGGTAGDVTLSVDESALFTNGTAGQVVLSNGSSGLKFETGYLLRETLYLTSSGTFSKGDYPWLKAVRVKMVGGGGGSGGANTTSSGLARIGRSGGGGSSSQSFILASSLTSSVSVVVGAGGAGGDSSNSYAGQDGGESSFGLGESFEVSAPGGNGGSSASANTFPTSVSGTNGGALGVGDLRFNGGSAPVMIFFSATVVPAVQSGLSTFFPAPATQRGGTASQTGFSGKNYGNGATGATQPENSGTDQVGGQGGSGIVILELFA